MAHRECLLPGATIWLATGGGGRVAAGSAFDQKAIEKRSWALWLVQSFDTMPS